MKLAPLLMICSLLPLARPAVAADTPAEAEAKVRAQYGDAFMDDVKALKAAEKDGYVQGVKTCLKVYAGAVDRDKQNAGKSEAELHKAGVAQEWRACTATCGKNLPAATPASVRPIAARYEAICKQKAGALDAVDHIKRFRAAMAKVPSAHGALDLMYIVAEAKGALNQAKEGAGESTYPVESKELAQVEADHKAELAKARKFAARPDVVELEQQRNHLRAKIEDYQKLGMTKQAEQAKEDLRHVDMKWAALAKEAGL